MLGARRMMARSARAVTQRRNAGGIPEMLQSNVWRKSTGMYITYIVAGCVVIEAVYGGVTDAIWNTYNSGVCLVSLSV